MHNKIVATGGIGWEIKGICLKTFRNRNHQKKDKMSTSLNCMPLTKVRMLNMSLSISRACTHRGKCYHSLPRWSKVISSLPKSYWRFWLKYTMHLNKKIWVEKMKCFKWLYTRGRYYAEWLMSPFWADNTH